MRTHWLTIAALAVIPAVVAPRTAKGQGVDSTTQRLTDVTVTISQDNPNYDGVYRARGMSRICGKLDFMMPHRANSFNVEFPDTEPKLAVPSLQFDADTLAPGDSTKSFTLSVGIRTPSGATPPHYVVRAKEEPKYGEPGLAIRAKAASTDTLRVIGTASKGTKVSVTMTLVCHPKQ